MKNAEGVFPSLPARNERGESWREGKLMKNGLLSPTLSSFFGEEREKRIAAAVQANCLPNSIGVPPVCWLHDSHWRDARATSVVSPKTRFPESNTKHILRKSGGV